MDIKSIKYDDEEDGDGMRLCVTYAHATKEFFEAVKHLLYASSESDAEPERVTYFKRQHTDPNT